MNPVIGFLRGYLTDAEMWLFLPLCVSVAMAVVCFFVVNHALELGGAEGRAAQAEADDSKADFRLELLKLGEAVTRRAKEKSEADLQAIAAWGEDALAEHRPTPRPEPVLEAVGDAAGEGLPAARGGSSSVSPAAAGTVRRRRSAKSAAAAASAEDASDNDWELVENEDVQRAEDSGFELPEPYGRDLDAFIEAVRETAPDSPPTQPRYTPDTAATDAAH